jgi:hypothetical protein
MNLVDRVKKILFTPTREWGVINNESHTVAGLYTQYVMILAAIPHVCTFIGFSVIGYGAFKIPMAAGLASMALGYAMSLGAVYFIALVIANLAPVFKAEKNFMQAFKVAAFFPTASWVAGVFGLVPQLAILSVLGTLYTLYLLHTGLGLMKVPKDKAIAYTIVVVIVTVIVLVAIAIVGALLRPGPLGVS